MLEYLLVGIIHLLQHGIKSKNNLYSRFAFDIFGTVFCLFRLLLRSPFRWAKHGLRGRMSP